MSYNIDFFTVKQQDSFTLPYEDVRSCCDEEPEINGTEVNFPSFPVECMEISGQKKDDRLHVTNICYGGEGSGAWWDSFLALLRKSSGKLRVLVVWEDGDTHFLVVNQGVVSILDID